MKFGRRALYLSAVAVIATVLIISVALVGVLEGEKRELQAAPDFTVTDRTGMTFSLSDFAGELTVLHVTQLEQPLCLECEDQMIGQILELSKLASANETDVNIVTLNVRKNPYSEEGWRMAEEYYGLNISWPWVEEFEPFPASGGYMDYWMLDGGFANPTIILIDGAQNVVSVRNIYCIGRGVVDGVQSAEILAEDSVSILSGEWDYESDGMVTSTGVSAGGMFILGVITAFSPCSIALLMAMISYIGSMRTHRKEPVDDASGLGTSLEIGLGFTLGMALTFFVIGLLLAYIGGFLEMSSLFYLVAGVVLIAVGINAIYPLSVVLARLKISLGMHSRRTVSCESPLPGQSAPDDKAKLLKRLSGVSPAAAGLLLGVLFSVGWAPCAISLVFPVIVLMLTAQYTLLGGALMLFIFGLGHGVVIIPFCAATGEARKMLSRKYTGAGKWVQLAFGAAVIVIGVVFAIRFVGFKLW